MCQLVRTPEGVIIASIGELRQRWPSLIKAHSYHWTTLADECCLCPVDIYASAAANDVHVSRTEGIWQELPPEPKEVHDGVHILREPAP